MIELTEEQGREIHGPQPVRVVDPATKVTYVLVREDVYQRIVPLFEDTDPEALYPLLAEIEPDDWEEASAYGIKRPT